jgi:hypothetical protein
MRASLQKAGVGDVLAGVSESDEPEHPDFSEGVGGLFKESRSVQVRLTDC